MSEAVVLVHGLWMNGVEMGLMGRRLTQRGYRVHRFSYPTVRRRPATNADALAAFLRRVDAPVVHLVAHSLGGLVVLHLFDRHEDLPPGRVVLLGSPVSGSVAARLLRRARPGAWAMGRAWHGGLDGRVPPWRGGRELGTIAGSLPLGSGLIVGTPIAGPNDGTIAVAETRLRGAEDRCVLPVSHTGLVVAPRVSRQVAGFLENGRFTREAGLVAPEHERAE